MLWIGGSHERAAGPIRVATPKGYRVMNRLLRSVRLGLVVLSMLLFSGALTQAAGTPTPPASPAPVATPGFTKLDLNTATDEQILAIPGLGDRMLDEFKEYRPYTSIVQFRREIGKYVDASQVTTWEQYVYVPVDPNAADAETLKQLPGVDDAIAQALIDGRPYASNDAFLAALAKHVSTTDAAAAAPYLVQS